MFTLNSTVAEALVRLLTHLVHDEVTDQDRQFARNLIQRLGAALVKFYSSS